ncbi:MAG TPA: HAD-IIA family hydrolase [Candidatus Acidoferrum sp.]|nr:HAD-IIA family hydrolase [Candidatus Acidoferrum sp.]
MLASLRGFVFDLDGCVWTGNVLSPGARETLAALSAAGRRLAYVSNNSRATGAELAARLRGLGVSAGDQDVLTPLDIIGRVIAEAYGRARVLVMGADELARAVARAGHEIVDFKRYREAGVVVVGNDFDLSYERLTAAARAAAAGAPLVTPNVDPRLPIESGEFLPGCGAIVRAVAVAAGRPIVVVGKPEPPLFRVALEHLGLTAAETAMVGDSVPSDIRGGRGAGMRTVLYAPSGAEGASERAEADVVVASFAELAEKVMGPSR